MFRKQSPLKNSRLVKRKRRIFYIKILIIIVLVGLALWGITALSRANFMVISAIEVEGNVALDSAEVITEVQKHISGNYLYLFPRTNKFFYPKNKINDSLKESFIRLDALEMSVSGNKLKITISERVPAFTWCVGAPQETRDQECYFLDE